jgi:TonB family protein
MTIDSLKQHLKLLIGRVRDDYWPRLKQDVSSREPRSLFFRALLLGFLLSVPWQCTRIVYNRVFTDDENRAMESNQPLIAPDAASSVTGMPNPKARRPALPVSTPQAPETESDISQTPDQTVQAAPAKVADQQAHVIERKALDYPVASLRNGEAGSVTIRVRINATGEPVDAKIEQSSGFRNLDRAARQAVMRWTYAPKIDNGTAVETEILVPVDFKIGH